MADEPSDEPPESPRLTAILGENAVTEIHAIVSDAIQEHVDADPEPASETSHEEEAKPETE